MGFINWYETLNYDVGVLRKKLLHGNGAVALYSQSQCLISTSFISNFIASSGFFFLLCASWQGGYDVKKFKNKSVLQTHKINTGVSYPLHTTT